VAVHAQTAKLTAVPDSCCEIPVPPAIDRPANRPILTPTAITKGASERFARMFNREHGSDIRTVRAQNAYGEHQKHFPVRKIVPRFVRFMIEATGRAPEIEHLPMRPGEPAGTAVMGNPSTLPAIGIEPAPPGVKRLLVPGFDQPRRIRIARSEVLQ